MKHDDMSILWTEITCVRVVAYNIKQHIYCDTCFLILRMRTVSF